MTEDIFFFITFFFFLLSSFSFFFFFLLLLQARLEFLQKTQKRALRFGMLCVQFSRKKQPRPNISSASWLQHFEILLQAPRSTDTATSSVQGDWGRGGGEREGGAEREGATDRQTETERRETEAQRDRVIN